MVTNSVLSRVPWLKAEPASRPANPIPADEQLAFACSAATLPIWRCWSNVIIARCWASSIASQAAIALGRRPNAGAFLRALRSIQQYQPTRPFKPWLYAIAVNVARDHFKRAEVRYAVTLADDDLLALADPIGLEETIEIDGPRVAAAIGRCRCINVKPLCCAITKISRWPKIAEALKIPVGTVKSRLSLGVRRLRVKLKDEQHATDDPLRAKLIEDTGSAPEADWLLPPCGGWPIGRRRRLRRRKPIDWCSPHPLLCRPKIGSCVGLTGWLLRPRRAWCSKRSGWPRR